LLGVQKIEPMTGAHSSMLSDRESVYELATHNIRSGAMSDYPSSYESMVKTFSQKCPGITELLGSWQIYIGNQDQVVHIWRYKQGMEGADQFRNILISDPEMIRQRDDVGKFCSKRRSTIMLSFSFWNDPKPRGPKHIYEMRRYVLKPGTMIEWGNNWARGIRLRRDYNQDFGGFFAQIGQLYVVYHVWAYKDLKHRKQVREETWRKPGWDTTVAYTVPLIRTMQSKLMLPTTFSPSQ